MSSETDLKHWYDGYLYRLALDPWIGALRKMVRGAVAPNSTVVDIGCGTGALALSLADRCSFVCGVDLSSRMIALARRTRRRRGLDNVAFVHADGADLGTILDRRFDYATIVMALHEMPPPLRSRVLGEMARAADAVIAVDFSAPQPRRPFTALNHIAEFLAGPTHFSHSRMFLESGGLEALFDRCGLRVIRTETSRSRTYRMVVGVPDRSARRLAGNTNMSVQRTPHR